MFITQVALDTVIVHIGMVVGVLIISDTMDTGVLVLVGAILFMVDFIVHGIMEDIITTVTDMDTVMDMVTVMDMLIIEEEEILVMRQEETLTPLIEQLAAQEML